MKVRLIAKTQGVAEAITGQELISYVARVSNPSNQSNFDTAPKLLRYLIKHAHWSPFEHAFMTVEIVTSRAIAAQILRHRSFVFQEFCIAGDTQISCSVTGYARSFSIRDLYRQQSMGLPLPKARIFDSAQRIFLSAPIKEVFATGKKFVFRVTLSNGKVLVCTQEHKFLSRKGFVPLKELTVGSAVACNGVPAHQDYELLKEAKIKSLQEKSGVPGMAVYFGVSYHTIRKWLKIHGLQFTKKETASLAAIWNKGLPPEQQPRFGKSHSGQTREKMRKSSRKGEDCSLYKTGASEHHPFRLKVWQWTSKHNFSVRQQFNNKCVECSSSERVQIDHIKPVNQFPELAFDRNNLQLLCVKCHGLKTKIDLKHTVKWALIESITPLGEEETFDMEVDHWDHNYVANGIVTHNSQRYAEAMEYEPYEARRQDLKNRQNSVDDLDPAIKHWFAAKQDETWNLSYAAYKHALEIGIAKEQARFLLPLNTQTTMYMTGSVRSWIHWIEIRGDAATQKEHRDIALAVKEIFKQEFPDVHAAIEEMRALAEQAVRRSKRVDAAYEALKDYFRMDAHDFVEKYGLRISHLTEAECAESFIRGITQDWD